MEKNSKKAIRITKNILADKELFGTIKKKLVNNWSNESAAVESFIYGAECWIKAIKEGRMICVIKSVSSSGMSRQFSYNSAEKGTRGFHYRQYFNFLKALGYRMNEGKDTVTIGGCGMDMNFNTNYNIIHRLHRLGFITKAQCATLSQQTPTVL